MTEPLAIPHLEERIAKHARLDQPLLKASMTVDEALQTIRREGLGERIVYFYAVDDDRRLLGVLPTRRLLTAPAEERLESLMVPHVVAIPATATVLDACELFVLYKFFAFPVVDAQRRVIGVIDVSLFTAELLETPEAEMTGSRALNEEIFEAIGLHLERLRNASPWQAFRYRFPWLIATIAGGTACALLAGAFEQTIASSVVIAFFLTMVLGLNESVSMQSMTMAIQLLRSQPVTWRWLFRALWRELRVALLLGAGCGVVVAAVVWLWRDHPRAAFAIGSSICLSLVTACLFGLAVPAMLHRFKLDPKIAAGPVTLAATDFVALTFYFGAAWLVL